MKQVQEGQEEEEGGKRIRNKPTSVLILVTVLLLHTSVVDRSMNLLDSLHSREFYFLPKTHLEPSLGHLQLSHIYIKTSPELKEQEFCCHCFLFYGFSLSWFAQCMQTSVHLTFIYLRVTSQ